MNKVAINCAALILACGSTQAAEQTPENAYRFLNVLATEHGLELFQDTGDGTYNQGWWNGKDRDGYTVNGRFTAGAFKLVSVEGPACRATFKWEKDRTPLIDNGMGVDMRNAQTITGISFPAFATSSELVVDWSKVPAIRNYSNEVTLVGLAKLRLPTPELATRLQYAMEFLRNACDKTAATGF